MAKVTGSRRVAAAPTNKQAGLSRATLEISGCLDIQLVIFWSLLPLMVVFLSSMCFLFNFLCLSSKFEEDPISGCRHIQLLIFWGHLPFEVVFVLTILWFDALSFSSKFKENPTHDCWDIQLLILWGCLPMDVVFVLSMLNFGSIP